MESLTQIEGLYQTHSCQVHQPSHNLVDTRCHSFLLRNF